MTHTKEQTEHVLEDIHRVNSGRDISSDEVARILAKLRFTLRDWCWLVLMIGIMMAWATDHWRLLEDIRHLESRMMEMGIMSIRR